MIIPVKIGRLSKSKIIISDLEHKLDQIGAKFAFILEVETKKGRTWDNLGSVEDIATGSSAGPIGAYYIKHGFAKIGEKQTIVQGEFLNRPSQIQVMITGKNEKMGNIFVSGDVCNVAKGSLLF